MGNKHVCIIPESNVFAICYNYGVMKQVELIWELWRTINAPNFDA